jgi:DNA-binding transcriptional ArsR family regulator
MTIWQYGRVANENLPLGDKMVELIARRFRLLGEPFRLRILQLLEAGERSVNEIVEGLQASQSNVSKHLGLLYDGGLVGRRRERSKVVYFIADPVIIRLCDLVCQRATDHARSTLAEMARPAQVKVQRKKIRTRSAK